MLEGNNWICMVNQVDDCCKRDKSFGFKHGNTLPKKEIISKLRAARKGLKSAQHNAAMLRDSPLSAPPICPTKQY
eukprot:4378441-Ditylum_brightwellii.AAC.2